MFSALLDEGKPYEIIKNKFIGFFGGLHICIIFHDEKQYDDLVKRDPLSFESIVILYDAKIVFDKSGNMTKNLKLVNKGGKKLKKSELLDYFYRVAKKIESLEKAYKDEDVLYFFNTIEQIKEGFTTLLFYMNGKAFFTYRDLKGQIEKFEVMPQDFFSNILLATQIDDVQKKIALLKRVAYTFGLVLGIADEKKEYVQVRETKTVGSDIRKVVEDKIKAVSMGSIKPQNIDGDAEDEDDEVPETEDGEEEDEKEGEEEEE
jgi:hypothetical protein